MKIGNSVRVKKGIMSPDYNNLNISGWEGRVIEIEDQIITIELDSITLTNLSKEYIMDSLINDFEYTSICLELNEIEITQPRDTQKETNLKQKEIDARYSYDAEKNRIEEILQSDDCSVSQSNLKKYFDYLKLKLQKPCILTGSEDFDWEEPYLLGGWSKKEYAKLKLTQPSYTDKFEFVDFVKDISDWKGIFIKVIRISDKKHFELPLWDLKVIDENSPNFLIISDYSSWMTNYQ